MTAAVALPTPKPVGQLRVLSDRFVCPPYRAVLTAKACVDRQRVAREQGSKSIYDKCFDCAIGKQVATLVDVQQVDITPCAKPGCDRGAKRGRWCDMHFKVAPEARRERAAHRRPLEPHLEAIVPKRPPAPTWKHEPTELERANAAEHDGDHVPESAPAHEAEREESTTMAKRCKRTGCTRNADPERGDGDLCMPHWRGERVAEAQTGLAKAKPARARAKPQPKPRAARPPKRETIDGAELTEVLTRAGEALELVEAIGWELTRDIAARVRGE